MLENLILLVDSDLPPKGGPVEC